LKKKEFSLEAIKNKFSTKTKYKPESFYNCGEALISPDCSTLPLVAHLRVFGCNSYSTIDCTTSLSYRQQGKRLKREFSKSLNKNN
jgi:hypothetical protein